jgi:hypothetical protein
MDVCVRLFCVYVSCVQVATFWQADYLSKDSYHLCKKDYENWRRGQGPTKGCRAIDEWMKNYYA